MTNVILGQQARPGCTHRESYLVITGTMPGKGRAWERSSINGWVHFLFWGESESAGGILSLPTTKVQGHQLRLQTSPLSEWSEYGNMKPFFLLPNTKTCPKEGNRNPFVISALGWSLRCFSEFMVHSSLELPYTLGWLMLEWDLGQGQDRDLRFLLKLLGREILLSILLCFLWSITP